MGVVSTRVGIIELDVPEGEKSNKKGQRLAAVLKRPTHTKMQEDERLGFSN